MGAHRQVFFTFEYNNAIIATLMLIHTNVPSSLPNLTRSYEAPFRLEDTLFMLPWVFTIETHITKRYCHLIFSVLLFVIDTKIRSSDFKS